MPENKVMPSEAGHWYEADGAPRYEIASKNGELRPTTLRDAKKYGYLPSVSKIVGLLEKPGLNVWKETQLLLSAYTCPINRDAPADEWMERVKVDAKEQSIKAMEKGVITHANIEKWLLGQSPDPAYDIRCLKVQEILKNYDALPIEPEKSFGSLLHGGFGGKIDILSTEKKLIADIKTSEFTMVDNIPVKAGKKTKLNWDEQVIQLAGYALGIWGLHASDARLVNIYISTVSDDVVPYEWSFEDIQKAIGKFELLLQLWWLINK